MRSSLDVRFLLSMALLGGLVVHPGHARAQQPSKESCLEAHGRGQDLRDAGKFSQAREQFLKCAQSACPALVQADCARFGDDLQRVVPTVTFAARDAQGADVPDTTIFVDDVQLTTRLDGKSYELDPGARTVRFVHDGKTVEQRVVISQGEKGRMIVVTLAEPSRAAGAQTELPRDPAGGSASGTSQHDTSRSSVPIVFAGIGGAALVAGVVLLIAGNSKIPDNCQYFAKECTAAAGDPVFDEAKSGAGMINAGVALGTGGLVVLGSSLIWYFAQSSGPAATTGSSGVSPWLGRSSTGLSFRSAF